MPRNKITQEEVKSLFDYREDGFLIRKKDAQMGLIKIGAVVGCIGNCGYYRTYIKGKNVLVHQLVWLWHYGYIPENEIDHIDRNRANNRIENLREVSRTCNARNLTTPSNNTSGVKGLSWYKRQNIWEAHISKKGIKIHIGRSEDYVEAVAMRLAAEQFLDWPSCDSSSSAFLYMQRYLKEVRS